MTAAKHIREARAVYLTREEPALLHDFDLLATAEGGVAKLRQLILSLAVRGKLATHDPCDESADVLFEKIQHEKSALTARGKLKRGRLRAQVEASAIPFELPANWRWTRLGDATKKITDGTHHSPPNTAQGDFKYISAKNIKPWGLDLSNVTYVTRSVHEEIYARCDPELGDVLYIKDGATTGVVTINSLTEPFSLLSSVALLKPSCGLTSEFLTRVMASPFFYGEMRASMTGVAITRVTLGKLEDALIPLPPLAEQHRIVARVKELMQLCDALETHGRLQDEQHAQLVATLFDALAASASAHALADHWRRIAAHFDLLLDRPEAVDTLEQTLLQLAVRGLLVPHDPTDEPASKLLQKIQTCRAELRVTTGNSKHAASRDGPVFNLPTGWEAVGLLDVCSVGGGATPSKSNPNYWNGDIPWVSPKDMKVDVIEDSQDHVSPKALNETRLPLVTKNSLLVVVRGMILVHSFPVAVTAREVTLNQDMKSFTPYLDELTDFFALALKGFKPEILSLVARSTHGTCKLESEKLFGFTFGLPPLAEQHRIVARVEQLRRLCADLRERLQQSRTTQSRLADARVQTVQDTDKANTSTRRGRR